MDSTNAVAGPSKLRDSSSPTLGSAQNTYPNSNQSVSLEGGGERLPLFLKPPDPIKFRPAQHTYIKSTNDLLGQLHLHEAYDKYVRPFYATGEEGIAGAGMGADGPGSPTTPGGMGFGGVDKGKGREVPLPGSTPAASAQTPAGDGQDGDDDEGGKGEKKKKNSYKHLIKGVPGKHSMRKDDYFTMMMQTEPKSRTQIQMFGTTILKNAFEVSLEGIKGWNTSTLVVPSAQAKEDRRKRKELKRLQKAQLQAQQQNIASASAPTPNSNPNPHSIQAPIPTSATSASFSSSIPRPGMGTPRPTATGGPGTPRPSTASATTSSAASSTTTATATPGITRPGSRPGVPPVQIPAPGVRVGTPLRTATPTVSVPHPLSAPPLSANSLGSAGGGGFPGPQNANPHANAAAPVPMPGAAARGQKRPRDEVVTNTGAGVTGGVNGVPVNGAGNAPSPPKPIVGAKAGNNGVRPRPLKKQRMDTQGAPVQQPTPQGV